MCGIAGIVRFDPSARTTVSGSSGCATSCAIADPTARDCARRSGGLAHRRLASSMSAGGAQPLANEDGSVLAGLQRRDLQPRRAAAASSRRAATLPHAVRHRDDRARLRGVGRRTASSASAACSRSRSGTRRRGGCCSPAIGSASSRSTTRDGRRRCSSRRRSRRSSRSGLIDPRSNAAVLPELLATRYVSGDGDAVRRIQQAAARAHADVVTPRRATAPSATGTADRDRSVSLERPERAGAEFRCAARASRSRSRLMSDVPLGHVPVRAASTAARRRADGAADRPAAPDVLGRVRGPRLQRARVRARGRRRDRGRSPRDRRSTRATSSARCRGWSGTRTSRSRIPSSVPLYFVSRAGARARHGRAHRRGRRRAARRLQLVSASRPGTGGAGDATSSCAAAAARAAIAAQRSCRLPRGLASLCEPIVPGDDPARPGDVLRQLRRRSRDRAARTAARLTIAPRQRRRIRTRAGWLLHDERARHARSTGCSTPTSRPISSSC